MKEELGEIKIIFSDEGNSSVINELVDFLKQFKGVYAYSLTHPKHFQNILPEKPEDIEKSLLPINWVDFYVETNLSEKQVSRSYQKKLDENDIRIIKINKQSPLEIIIECVIIFGALALIFGGGTVKWSKEGGLEVELKSLGEGIQHMTKALSDISERRETLETRSIRVEAIREDMTIKAIHERRLRFIEELKELNDILNTPNLDEIVKERLRKTIIKITEKLEKLGFED